MLGLLIVVVIILVAVVALRAQSGHWRPRERWVSPRQYEAANRAAWYAPMVAELP
jgi:type II secretory pathway component PulK